MAVEAVIWDFGGVFTTSPFEAFNRYEAARGLPKDLIRTINALEGFQAGEIRVNGAPLTRAPESVKAEIFLLAVLSSDSTTTGLSPLIWRSSAA